MSVNKVILLGNVGNDPEIASFGERKMVKFSLATSERYTDKSGEKQEKTEWHRVTFWGKPAEILHQYLKKGSKLYIEGRIETSKVGEGDDAKYYTNIVGSTFSFVSSKQSDDTSNQAAAPTSNDDLPF